MNRKTKRAYHNTLLLLFIVLLVCCAFLIHMEVMGKVLNSLFFTLVLLSATFAIQNNRRQLLFFAVGVIVLREISRFLVLNNYFDSFATLTNVVFFLVIVIRLIHQVAHSRVVDRDVILESVNGYLLMGLIGSILIGLVDRIQEHAFSFANPAGQHLSDYIYLGFITQTTIGYGDITPLTDLARLLTIIIGICGQLYIAVIIAMLVGKYLSQQNQNQNP